MNLLLGYVLAVAVLAYASFSDVKTREVSDLVWVFGCAAALLLDAWLVLCGELQPLQLAFSVTASAALAAAFYFPGLVGGADALALVFVGLAVPAYPEGFRADPFPPVYAVVCNSAMISLACPAAVFAFNLADILRRKNPFESVEVGGLGELLVLMFTARRVSVDKLKSLHYFPSEKPVVEGGRIVRKPVLFVRAEEDVSAIVAEVEAKRNAYADGVLASPTLPMVVFLAFGLAVLPFGNVLLQLLRLFV